MCESVQNRISPFLAIGRVKFDGKYGLCADVSHNEITSRERNQRDEQIHGVLLLGVVFLGFIIVPFLIWPTVVALAACIITLSFLGRYCSLSRS